MKKISTLAIFLLLLAVPVETRAADTFLIDTTHSSVTFSVRHLLSKTRGRFTDFAGTIQLDQEQPANSSVSATIQTASINTDNTNRDEHLRNPDFFDASRFPEITFESTGVKKSGDTLQVTGKFTMRGVTREVTLDVEFFGVQDHPRFGTRAGFEGTTTINRQDFGVSYGAPVVGDDVTVTLSIEAVKKKDTPKPSQ